jgi:hypothetical protein
MLKGSIVCLNKQWAPASVLGCNTNLLWARTHTFTCAGEMRGFPDERWIIARASSNDPIHDNAMAAAIWASTVASSGRGEGG